MRDLMKWALLLSIVAPTHAFALTAAQQTPATSANTPINVNLTTHATGVMGSAAATLIQTRYTTGSATLVGNNLVYQPSTYFPALYSGQSASDYVGYCLTDSSMAVSCNFVQISVSGVGTAPAHNTYYFSPSGSDTGAGTTASPWLWVGAHAYAPGDVLYLMDGTFTETGAGTTPATNVTINSAGTAAQPIHLACQHALACTIKNASTGGSAISITGGAAYWDIGGLGGINITTDATATTGPSSPDGFGIKIASQAGAGGGDIHHITIAGNSISSHGAGGIAAAGNNDTAHALDYIKIYRNVVYNNSRWSSLHGSGISIFQPHVYDTDTRYHITILSNVSYDNNDCDSGCTSPTDGNGIILDDFGNTQFTASTPYTAPTLVADNIIFGNGGRGIHVFSNGVAGTPSTTAIDVLNNTACGNNNDVNVAIGSSYEIGLNTGGGSFVYTPPPPASPVTYMGGDTGFYNNANLTTHNTNLNVNIPLMSSAAAGSDHLTLTTQAGLESSAIANATGIPPLSASYPNGDWILLRAANVIQLFIAPTTAALPAGSIINFTGPVWAMGDVQSSMDVYRNNLMASPYGYTFWNQFNSPTNPDIDASNIGATSAGFTCPTYTTLKPLATLIAAVTPGTSSNQSKAGTSILAYPTDINGKLRNSYTDIGAVQSSP